MTGLRRDDLSFLRRELPEALVVEAEANGGFWFGGSSYHTEQQIIEGAHEHDVRSLRLVFRDVTFLTEVPNLQHLWLQSDSWVNVASFPALPGLRALLLDVKSLRGEFDPFNFEELRWFKAGLGGKGGAMLLPVIERGHPCLTFLSVRETKARTLAEIVSGFPALQEVRIAYADRLRSLGDLRPVADTLKSLTLHMTKIESLEGIEVLTHLEDLVIFGGPLSDLSPLEGLPGLNHTDLTLAALQG